MVNRDLGNGVVATLYIKLEIRIVEMIWNVKWYEMWHHCIEHREEIIFFFDAFEKEIYSLFIQHFLSYKIYFLHSCACEV